MSAIAGIIYFDGRHVALTDLTRMTASMAARGPDGIAHFVSGSVGLGQCSFRTTPESLEESLPLTNEDESIVLVMDGRVDNYKEMRRELLRHGAILRTHGDAELVLRAYELWGEACANRIVGECVFVVFDAKQRRLFGCRDAAGTRHFYTHAGRGWFAFASEIGALLSISSIDRSLNEHRMVDYVVNAYDRDDQVGTFYKNIERLPTGHTLEVTLTGVKIQRYWDPRNLPMLQYASTAECAEAFREQLKIAVECRVRSLGPIAAMLSGGLDSSSIVALLHQDFSDRLNGALRTVTLTGEAREACAEWRHAQHLLHGTNLVPTVIEPAAVDAEWQTLLREATEADEPHELLPGLTNALAYRAAKRSGASVVFDGIAGDVLFWSADRSLVWALSHRRIKNALAVVVGAYRYQGIGAILEASKPLARFVVPSALLELRRNRLRKQRFSTGDLRILEPAIAREYESERECARRVENEADRTGKNPHGELFVTGSLSFAHEVYGTAAQRAGVDPRSPFSDRRMIEFAVQMPPLAKAAVWRYKQTLRTAMASYLPEEILMRDGQTGHPGSFYWDRLGRILAADAKGDSDTKLVSWLRGPAHDEGRQRVLNGTATEEAGYQWLVAEVLLRWRKTHADLT